MQLNRNIKEVNLYLETKKDPYPPFLMNMKEQF